MMSFAIVGAYTTDEHKDFLQEMAPDTGLKSSAQRRAS
jgi:hypothetical protein